MESAVEPPPILFTMLADKIEKVYDTDGLRFLENLVNSFSNCIYSNFPLSIIQCFTKKFLSLTVTDGYDTSIALNKDPNEIIPPYDICLT